MTEVIIVEFTELGKLKTRHFSPADHGKAHKQLAQSFVEANQDKGAKIVSESSVVEDSNSPSQNPPGLGRPAPVSKSQAKRLSHQAGGQHMPNAAGNPVPPPDDQEGPTAPVKPARKSRGAK